jgi:tetratricopeptide (TPR) repeat protein
MNREPLYPFSQAPFWGLQRRYYEEQGMKAWQNEVVPHYITSNPVIAKAYAEMLFAFMRDRQASSDSSDATIYILELGAGSGRLAFHLLKCIDKLLEESELTLPPFCYIMSDLPIKNVDFWKGHPSLQPFVEQGRLDFARFDAEHDQTIHLLNADKHICPGDLDQPLVVVANYFFDSIPQELLYVHDKQIYECWVSMQGPEEQSVDAKDTVGLIDNIKLDYHYRLADDFFNQGLDCHDIIEQYRTQLNETHILFPYIGLQLLERLRRLSKKGFMLITADKGDHRLSYWRDRDTPKLIRHGSFSFTANYHAFLSYYEAEGAKVYFTKHHYNYLNIGSILMVPEAGSYTETKIAYRRAIEQFGPDDFFSIKSWADEHLKSMELSQLFAYIRLSGYDALLFKQSAMLMMELLSESTEEDKEDLSRIIRAVWDGYYPIDEEHDLAFDCGMLLFHMEAFEEALIFFDRSIATYEGHASVFYNMAICHYHLGQHSLALRAVDQALSLNPEHEGSRMLLEEIRAEGL